MAAGPSESFESTEGLDLHALLERISRKDEAAFAKFYDSTSRPIYALILRIVGDGSAAEEVAMEVYLQVWRTAANYDASRGVVRTWLTTLARSRAIDWLRSNRRRLQSQRESLEDLGEPADASASPEALAMLDGRAKVVKEALASLPEDQKRLIELAYFNGFSQSELAEHLNMPLGTVKTKVRVGLIRMRELLGPYAGSGL